MREEGDICPSCGAEFEAGVFKECGAHVIKEVVRLRAKLKAITELVNEQAEDPGLWFIYPMGNQPVTEAYLQQELRKLHAVVEGTSPQAPDGKGSGNG